jgi:hypothetical protein
MLLWQESDLQAIADYPSAAAILLASYPVNRQQLDSLTAKVC